MATFEESAKPIRKLIQNFTTVSLFYELIKYLQQTPEFRKNGEISAPWVVLLAIDWVLELHPNSGKKNATQNDALSIINKIWRTQHLAVGSDAAPLSVQIRALLAPQLIYQRSDRSMAFFFLRLKKIIDADISNASKFRTSFLNRYSIEFDLFQHIAFIICIFCMNEKSRFFDFSVLVELITPHYLIEDVAKVINILSCTLNELVQKASREEGREIKSNEYFKESFFLNSPLFMTEKGLVVIHPSVALIGISEALIRCFIREDENNRTTFTRCFEEYVNNIHDEFRVAAIREDRLKEHYRDKGESGRKVVDFLIIEEGANIFLDAKGIDPNNNVLSATTRYGISQRICKQHINAVRQIIDTIDVLLRTEFNGIAEIENRFGLVVTHQDFFLGTGERILSYLSDDINQEIQSLSTGKILFKNIHFMTIEQYEKLNCIVSETGIKFHYFFTYVSSCESEPQNIKMTMDQYVESFSQIAYGYINVPNGSPKLLEEKERMFDEAITAVDSNRKFWISVGGQGNDGIEFFLKNRQMLFDMTFRVKTTQKLS